jgi:NADPH-dependent stearoyl-CoA 9-desaturase
MAPHPTVRCTDLDICSRGVERLEATSDDAPETHSELKFRIREGVRERFGVDPGTGRRRGLCTALRELQTGEVVTG